MCCNTETKLGEQKCWSMWLFIGCCQAATICSLYYNRFMMSEDCKFEWITEYDDDNITSWPSANSIITRACLQSILLQCCSMFTLWACPPIAMSHSERETHRPWPSTTYNSKPGVPLWDAFKSVLCPARSHSGNAWLRQSEKPQMKVRQKSVYFYAPSNLKRCVFDTSGKCGC